MTVRDSAAESLGCPFIGIVFDVTVSPNQITSDFVHEDVHRLAVVIARDIRMKILPCTLDLVIVRAVWWKEMEADPPSKAAQ